VGGGIKGGGIGEMGKWDGGLLRKGSRFDFNLKGGNGNGNGLEGSSNKIRRRVLVMIVDVA